MLINDLTLDCVTRDFKYPTFLLTCDADIKTPAVVIVDACDIESRQMAIERGYPVIEYEDETFFFPNGWKLTKNKAVTIKTKIFQLMKKFYQLPDEIKIADNITLHLINDWSESRDRSRWRWAFVIFILLSSHIYGGALKPEWFLQYAGEKSLRGVLSYYFRDFPMKFHLSGDLMYMCPNVSKDKKYDFYFFEQDFCGVRKVAGKI